MKKRTEIFSFFIFLILFCLFFTVNAHAGQWSLDITATGQDLIIYDPNIDKNVGNLNTSSVEIGQDPNAEAFSIIPSPFPYATVYMEIEDDLMVDYRPSDSIREAWNLIVKVEQYADTNDPNFFPVLSWDTNDIDPNTTLLELRLANNDETMLVPDMSTTSSYHTTLGDATATGYYAPIDPNYQFALMRYKVIYKDALSIITQEIPLVQGWNLTSFQVAKCFYQGIVPTVFIPEGTEKEKMVSLREWLSDDDKSPLRDAADPNYAGDWLTVISFDAEGGHVLDTSTAPQYDTLKYLSIGYGYWVKMNAPGTLILEGQPLDPNTSLKLRDGWNLIGYIPPDLCFADIPQASVCPFNPDPYNIVLYKTEEDIQYCPVEPLNPLIKSVATAVFKRIDEQYKTVISFDSCDGGVVFDSETGLQYNTMHYIGPKYGFWIKIENPPSGSTLTFPVNCSGI